MKIFLFPSFSHRIRLFNASNVRHKNNTFAFPQSTRSKHMRFFMHRQTIAPIKTAVNKIKQNTQLNLLDKFLGTNITSKWSFPRMHMSPFVVEKHFPQNEHFSAKDVCTFAWLRKAWGRLNNDGHIWHWSLPLLTTRAVTISPLSWTSHGHKLK